MNLLHRYCRRRFAGAGRGCPRPRAVRQQRRGRVRQGAHRVADGNRSVQYAGGRFTITPATAARAAEAESSSPRAPNRARADSSRAQGVAANRTPTRVRAGFRAGVAAVNHNLYSIEDVKLMIESWRHLNPGVSCALKFVATHGVEMVCLGGVNAGANRLHVSDGCGGTGAAKRVDQKHAGVPVAASCRQSTTCSSRRGSAISWRSARTAGSRPVSRP